MEKVSLNTSTGVITVSVKKVNDKPTGVQLVRVANGGTEIMHISKSECQQLCELMYKNDLIDVEVKTDSRQFAFLDLRDDEKTIYYTVDQLKAKLRAFIDFQSSELLNRSRYSLISLFCFQELSLNPLDLPSLNVALTSFKNEYIDEVLERRKYASRN